MNLFLKKILKKSVIDRPTILYTKMTQTNLSAASFSSGLGFTMPTSSSKGRIPVRSIILSLIVMATAIDYITRVNINIAIVTMVKLNVTDVEVDGEVCPLSGYHVKQTQNSSLSSARKDSDSHINGGEQFEWSPTTQGVVLGSFWYTYMLMQIPSGRMAETFGGKMIVTISLIGSGIINLITPFIASSTKVLIMSRMLLGVVQGGIFPSCYAMIGKWFPLKERSLGFAFMEIGATIGSVIATTSAGYLSEHGFGGGWPSVFYCSGLISLLSFFAWFSLTESSPLKYRGITSEELHYIRSGEQQTECRDMSSSERTSDIATVSEQSSNRADTSGPPHCQESDPVVRAHSVRVPWFRIFTSPPVLAIITSKFCLGWCFFTILTKLPAYLHDVLHVSPTQNGLLNASLYMTTCISLLTSSHVSEKLINDRILTRTSCRKTFLSIASFGTAFCLSLIPWAACNTNLVMFILLLGNFFLGVNAGGDVPVAGEMTTHFPATIYAIGNMFGCATGFAVPYVIGVILESGSGDLIFLWSKTFYLSAVIAVFGALIFIAFGDASKQEWDVLPEDQCVLDDFDNNDSLTSRNRRTHLTPPYQSCA